MKQIPLTQNKFALVDDKDFEWLNQWKWHYIQVGYAARREYPSRKYIYMHRFITNAKKGDEIDHVNYYTLDNRRENLRIADRSKNMANTKLRSTNKTGCKGLFWDKERNKWQVKITFRYKNIHLGRFDNKNDAIQAYNQAALKYFGEFARINSI